MTINTALSINCFTFQQEVARLPLPEKTIDKINYSQYSKCLTLEGEELQYLPEVLACCHHIQRLVLKGDLEFLPDAIGQCHNLKELCFSYNKLLKYVPDAISQCRELEVLKICKTELESLPDAIGNCHNLRELSVNSSKLKHLPITIGNCRELTMLSIENSELKNVPDMLGNCQNLRKICLDYNQLECLPENLGNCVSLEKLTFICNKVKDLPLTLDNCKKLTSLQLDYNQFEYLPEVVSNCTNLQFLGMLGNNWKSIVDITLSLSTMTSLRVNGLPPFVISEKKSPSDPTTNNKSSYDIVIVNPVHKGFGDYELGRKIQALVTKLDYSVKLQMTTEEPQEGLETRLIIVTPYSIEDADDMQRYIKNNFRIKQNTKVLMIDEMDAVQTEKKLCSAIEKVYKKFLLVLWMK